MNKLRHILLAGAVVAAGGCAGEGRPVDPSLVRARNERIMSDKAMVFVALGRALQLQPVADPGLLEDFNDIKAMETNWGDMYFTGKQLGFEPMRIEIDADRGEHGSYPSQVCASYDVPEGTQYVVGLLPKAAKTPVFLTFIEEDDARRAKLCFGQADDSHPSYVVLAASDNAR